MLADEPEPDLGFINIGSSHVHDVLGSWFDAIAAEGPRLEPVDPMNVQIIELEVPDDR